MTKGFSIIALFAYHSSSSLVSAFTTPSGSRSNCGELCKIIGNNKAFVPLRMSTEEKTDSENAVTVKSVSKKDILYDDKTGRFFEGGASAECIPDEEFCILDDETGGFVRLTVEEKERIFLDSLQSYYSTGRQVLKDEEFDLLKEDLQWSGSKMVQMNRKEAKYLTAMQDYVKGKPSLSDEEYDQLKADLKEEKSKFAVDKEPKCYIDTGICKATLEEDKFRNNLLYLPAGTVITLLWLALSFEVISPLVALNPLILLALGSPLIYKGAAKVTDEYLFQDAKIAYGPCPGCEREQRVYFGDVLFIEGYQAEAKYKCKSCKQFITIQKNTLRASTIPKN